MWPEGGRAEKNASIVCLSLCHRIYSPISPLYVHWHQIAVFGRKKGGVGRGNSAQEAGVTHSRVTCLNVVHCKALQFPHTKWLCLIPPQHNANKERETFGSYCVKVTPQYSKCCLAAHYARKGLLLQCTMKEGRRSAFFTKRGIILVFLVTFQHIRLTYLNKCLY